MVAYIAGKFHVLSKLCPVNCQLKYHINLLSTCELDTILSEFVKNTYKIPVNIFKA